MTKAQTIIGSIIAAGFVFLSLFIVYLFYTGGTEALKDHLCSIIMAWVVNFTTLVNYHYGSSKGSSDKNVALFNKKPGD